MEKTIKYLENGEYHYATVKDVGDLAKLKTDSKDDLVTAINELFITGGEASKKPDGYDELVDNVADAIQKQQQMTDTITNMQQSAQLSDTEMQHMKQVQEEAHQDYIKALKEFNDAIAQANADALELDKKTDELKKNADDLNKKTNDLQDKLNETFTNVANEVSAVHKQLDTESAGLHKELNDTKTSLEATRKDLLNNTQEFGVVNSEVKELKDKMDRRIWSTDLDPVREQVSKNSTEVAQTKDELKSKADQSNLDLVTNSVENLSTQVKENADGLKVSVKKDELGGDVAKLLNDKTNLLLGTRNFSGDSWGNKTFWHEEAGYWKGLKVFSSTEIWFGLQYKYGVKQGQQYTFSFWARQEKDNSSASIVLSESDKGDQGITTPYTRGAHIGTEWKRYSLTFQAESDGIIYPRVEQNVQGNKLYIAGYKLELGSVATPWEPNEADVAENIEHNESQFNVYSDQIAGIVKKQEKMGDTERQLDTRITETAEGLKQTSKDLQDANGKITEFKGQLESTARGLKTEYEKYTNDAIGQISDSSLNLIRNSAFQNKDDNFAQWQNVSAKANIREDSNGLRWVELTQSGMTTDNPQGITSNYFVIKQGKVTVAVDIKLGDKANLDNQNILLLELYNDNKQRVDFTDVSVSQLGLSTAILNDHNVHRGLYRLGIDRKDVKYMTVKAILHRNGDLWFTNFSARLSSIDDGGYTPNPDDLSQQILKMNTKIEEDAEHIALKANSVDVTRDIKSAVDGIQVGGTNVLKNTDPDSFSTTESDHTWTLESAGNGHGTIVDLDSNFSARHGFGIIGNTGGNKDFNQHPIRWNGGKYVFTVYIRLAPETTQTSVTALIRAWNYTKGTESYTRMIAIKSREWQKLSLEIDSSSFYKDDCGFSFGVTGIGSLNFAEPMLVTGTKAMDWSPAPEDTSAEIKSVKDAAIQVASDQINLHVNELSTQFDDKLNKRVNEVKTASEKFTSDGIEQTVKKITDVKNQVDGVNDKVNNLKVGGRNLVRNTDTDIVVDATSANAGNWTFARLRFTEQPKQGDLITVSAEGTLTGTGTLDKYRVVLFDVNNSTPRSQAQYLKAGKRDSVTLSLDNLDGYGDTILLIYAGEAGETKGKKNTVHHLKVEFGNLATDWTPAPEDINQKIETQTLDSANIDEMKTQGHYFVKSLTGNPLGSGWVYVDVIGNNSDRIRQDVYQDNGNKHMYRRLFGTAWSGWEQGAYLSDVNSLKTEVTASVKNLGDRVTTEVNSVTSKVNEGHSNDVELIRNSNFEDGNKGNWTDDSTTIISGNTIPSELGQDGMKVLRSVRRDIYEDGILYSVKPNETFDVDYWVWPTGNYDSQLGLCFWDNAKKIIECRGVTAKKGTGWTHYTGTIQAPANAGFAKPWFQINKDGSESASAAWMAKPSIRRHDNFADQKISEVNTKLDVANGQIQGKVTETQVQDLLNRGHYATQEWSQGQINLTKDQFNVDIKKVTSDLNSRVNEVKTASEKFTSDEIEQVVTKVTNVKNDVDRLGDTVNSIGSRNLLHNTSDQYRTLTGSDWFAKSTANDIYTSVANYHGGNQFTYAATITNPSNYPVRLVIYCYDKSKSKKLKTILGVPVSANQPNARVAVTTFIDTDTWWIRTNIETLQANTPQISIQVKDERLVEGTVSSSWSPNPDDINQQIDSIKTETTASVKNLGDRVTTEVNSITKKVDTNNGGGVNLLKATDFSSTDLTKLKDVWGSHFTLRDGKAMQLDQLKGNGDLDATQFLPVEPNTDYTLSFEAYYNTVASGGSYNNIYTFIVEYKDQNNTTPHYLDHMRVVANTADRSKNIQTIHTQKDCHYVQVFFRASAKTLFSFWRPKLERGSVATPWTPAPEDTSDAIKQLNTKWDVANGQIQGKVTATDVNNILNGKGYATQSWAESNFRMKSDSIDLEVRKITDPISNKLNNLQVGGRNLLHGTSDQWRKFTSDGWGCFTTAQSSEVSTAEYHTGNVFTYSATISNNGKHDVALQLRPLNSQKKPISYYGSAPVKPGQQNMRVSCTAPVDTNTWYMSVWVYFPNNDGSNDIVWVKEEQFEEGNVGTPWTPNPDDINQQITNTNNKIDTQTLDSANIDNMRTQGHYFVKNLTGNPIGGWVYVDVNYADQWRIRQDVYQDIGGSHVYRRLNGSSWTEWTTDVNNKNVISQINITPDQIKIASNKIEIDGNTKIHGVLDVKQVTLQGKSGYVDLSGDGINIAKNNGAGMNIGANAIQITSNTNGQAEVEGVITPAWSSNNVNQNGIGLILTTEQELGRPYGGDILTIGTMPKSGVIHSAMVFDATGITSTYKKGFNWFAPHTLNGDGGVFRFPNAQDDLVAYAGNIPGSRQEGYSQPTLALVHGKARGSAGLQFQWDDLVPFGRITSSMSYVSAPGTAGNDGITVGWYSYGAWYGDRRAPCIIYHGSDGSNRDGGIVFYPGGEVCFWQGDFHSNLRWSGIKNTD